MRKIDEEHRKSYGQFFTHPSVASFMVEWVLRLNKKSIYDPGFGLGAFLDPVYDDLDIEFSGSEIDQGILDFWQDVHDRNNTSLHHEDYLRSWGKSAANIVCNPPYMRFQKFLDRENVFNEFSDKLNLHLSGYTNIASAFLIKSLSELRESGRLAYIMPLEFLNTGYGTIVKNELIKDGCLAAIIRLDCEKDVFPDATTSVGIILYDSSHRYSWVDFHVADSINTLPTILEQAPSARISLNSLDPKAKWLNFFLPKKFTVNRQKTAPLNYYGRFSRGIATGANKFFILKRSRFNSLGLDESDVTPCITKSSQIYQAVFDPDDFDCLMREDSPVLLFSPDSQCSKKARSYISSGEMQGYHTRFLTKNRKPWYKTEYRAPSPLLLGVFSRGGYKIVLNRSKALNLTCFHGFQPNFFGSEYVDHLFLYMASSTGRDILRLSSRRYGDSLDKFEPNDLNLALVPSPQIFDELSQSDVSRAISHTQSNGVPPEWIDTFFQDMKVSIAESISTETVRRTLKKTD